jgi:hypothetical protein
VTASFPVTYVIDARRPAGRAASGMHVPHGEGAKRNPIPSGAAAGANGIRCRRAMMAP